MHDGNSNPAFEPDDDNVSAETNKESAPNDDLPKPKVNPFSIQGCVSIA